MPFIIIGIPFFIGLGFLFISYILSMMNKKLITQGNTTIATVIENRKTDLRDVGSEIGGTRGHIGGKTYFPVLKYEINGVTYTEKGSIGHPSPKYYVGQAVKIYCDSKNPDMFLIDGEQKSGTLKAVKVIGWLLIVIGLIVGLIVYHVASTAPTLTYEPEYSYFKKWHIENNKVFIVCWLRVKNHTKRTVSFTLSADFSYDIEYGLAAGQIVAENMNDGSQIFTINPNATTLFKCEFSGDFAGHPTKSDREPAPPETVEFDIIQSP